MLRKILSFLTKPKPNADTLQIIDSVKTRANEVKEESDEHFLSVQRPKTGIRASNWFCTSLDNFVIDDRIGPADLQKLASLNKIQLSIKKGWYPLLIDMIRELDKAGWDRKVSCIKEKYAELCFYSDSADQDICKDYKERSTKICETCGEKGIQRYNNRWIYVACRRHYIENRGEIKLRRGGFMINETDHSWFDIADASFEKTSSATYYKLNLTFKSNIMA